MAEFNKGFDIEKLIEGLPPGLERVVLRVLQYHVGQDQAIRRGDLVRDVRYYLGRANERAIRATINLLRKDGFPICSTGGVDGGYWIAAAPEELDEYLNREVKARVKDLQAQLNALTRTMKELWGEGVQGRLL